MNNVLENGIQKYHLRTLKEISRPDPVDGEEQEPVINSPLHAIYFDNVTAEYAKNLERAKVPTSVDALYQHDNGDVYFVEFKSSKPEGKSKREELKLKAVEGVLTFMELAEVKRACIRKCVTFIVVFKDNNKNVETAKEQIRDKRQKRGRQLTSKGLELSRLKRVYFKDAGAMTNQEFDAYITEQGWTSMA